jgi:hypothetical protein
MRQSAASDPVPKSRHFWPQTQKETWPPYHLVEDTLAQGAQRKLDRLERLYHVGQDNVWDGRQVLSELIAKHGPPRLDPATEPSALKILSILMWGELAAWAISADLAERIDDVDAKMAATSQAHDEARHFYVLRDYLNAIGKPVPHLPGLGRRLLIDILSTDSLVHKLVGMQLLVESNALAIFRALAESKIEPILCDLMPFYERDEARHVGLGVLYLPRLMAKLSTVELAGVVAFQLRCVGMLMTAGLPMRQDFIALRIDERKMAWHTIKLQDEIVRDMLSAATPLKGRRAIKSILNPSKGYGPAIVDFLHPPGGLAQAKPWHRAALRVWTRGAELANRALD